MSLEVNNPNSYAVTLVSVAVKRDDHGRRRPLGLHDDRSDLSPTRPGFRPPSRAAPPLPDPPARGGVDEFLVVERLPGGHVLHPRHDHGGQGMSPRPRRPRGPSQSGRRSRAGCGGALTLVALAGRSPLPSGRRPTAPTRRRRRPQPFDTERQATETAATSVKISWTAGSQPTGTTTWCSATPAAAKSTSARSPAPTSNCTDSGLEPGDQLQLLRHRRARQLAVLGGTASFTTMAVDITSPTNGSTFGANWAGSIAGHLVAGVGTSHLGRQGVDPTGQRVVLVGLGEHLDRRLPELRGDGRHRQQLDADLPIGRPELGEHLQRDRAGH